MDPIEITCLGALALVRITAMLMTAPVLGDRAIPIRFKLLLAIVLTAVTLPMLLARETAIPQQDLWASSLFSELTIGLTLGIGVAVVFAAARMAGTVISQMASLPVMQGSADMSSPVGQMFGVLSLAAFVLMNGPELVLTATLDTFVYLPIGTSLDTTGIVDLTVELLRQSFLLTLRGVAPAVTAMMISTIVVGVISRNYPQVNLLSLGLTSNLSIMLLALFFTLGGCVWLFVDDFQHVLETIHSTLAATGTGTPESLSSDPAIFAGATQEVSGVR